VKCPKDALIHAYEKALNEVDHIADEMLSSPLRHKKDHITGPYMRGYINALRILKANIDTLKK
jgi:peptide deformylase